MGSHVELDVHDLGNEHMRRCAAKEFSSGSSPPKFHVRIASLVWNSTPSQCRNRGTTLAASTPRVSEEAQEQRHVSGGALIGRLDLI